MAAGFWFNALLVCGHFRSRWNEIVKLWNRNKGVSFAVDRSKHASCLHCSCKQGGGGSH
jgi:hypothetical protein